MWGRRYLHVASLLGLASLGGCSSSADEPRDCAAKSAASLDVGVMSGDTFVPFASADPISVVHGFQGGMWVMPSLLAFGLGSLGRVSAALALPDGTPIGSYAVNVKLESGPEGSQLLRRLPVPVGVAPGSPSLAELDGEIARLNVVYVDDCEISAAYEQLTELHMKDVTE